MKIVTLLMISLMGITWAVSAQSVGEYRSIASGNWNDATRWQVYNGNNWVSASTYPGQNSNAGGVTIGIATQIIITASVPNSISSLGINTDFDQVQPPGRLVFSSANAVSLTVAGNVIVYGSIAVADQSGAKIHSLTIQGGLVSGTWTYVLDTTCVDLFSCPVSYNYFYGDIQTISNDDKLAVIFNTTNANSSIGGLGGIVFQDITFNGAGISIQTPIYINGNANFINGVVTSGNFCNPGCALDASGSGCTPSSCGTIFFNDGSTISGPSVNSFVDGRVWKQGDDPFTFPIGTQGIYSPLTISAPVGVATFSARYVRSGQDPSLWGITDPGLYTVSNCEYWELNPGDTYFDYYGQTSYPLNVTVGWSPSSNCGSSYVTNVPNMTLAHFNGTSWDTHGGSAMGTTSGGTITRIGVNYFGSFTLSNMNANCVAPSGLNVTNITTTSATLGWSVLPDAVSYDVSYRAVTTNNWTNVATAITSTSINVSGLSPIVTYDWKVNANCSSSSSAYRAGPQFTTQNPCGTPSGLSATNVTSSSASLSWSTVINGSYTVQYKVAGTTSWIDAVFNIGSTSYNLSGLSAATTYDWRVYALCYYSPTYTYYGGTPAQASFTTTACNDVYETNNTSSQAKAINLGSQIIAGIFSFNDVDWFKITTPNNSNTRLQVTLSNLPADYDLYVYNKNLTLVGSSINNGASNEVVIFDSHARNATYYIKVIGKNGSYNSSQCYNLLAQGIVSGGLLTRTSDLFDETMEPLNDKLLFPNPASNVVYIRFHNTVDEAHEVEILNTVGQLVKRYSLKISKGYHQVPVPVNDIAPGMYILKINEGELNIIRKFVIAR